MPAQPLRIGGQRDRHLRRRHGPDATQQRQGQEHRQEGSEMVQPNAPILVPSIPSGAALGHTLSVAARPVAGVLPMPCH